jgi:hypothetical protein
MTRAKVDDNRSVGCSQGLHAGALNYVAGYGSLDAGDKIVIVKINPKDVVSVPNDCNCEKLRTCRYEVVAEYKDDWRSKIDRGESGWNSPLYSSNGGEYDEDDDCDYDDSYLDEEDYEESFNNNQNDYYGVKPSGHKFHNLRDNKGKFTKKNW